MARSKRTYRAQTQTNGAPQAGASNALPRPLNLRARNRSIECRWAPDVESKLGQTTPVSSAELEAVCQLLGEDLDRLLRD